MGTKNGRDVRPVLEFEMAEVLIEYDSVVTADDGTRWVAQACGRPGRGTIWEGWLEFVPLFDAELRPIRSRRETTQPNRDDLVYWATGLTPVYLKGALARTLEPAPRSAPLRSVRPAFEGPAPNGAAPPTEPSPAPHSILDPFEVYAQGEGLLLRQLDALDTAHLRDIVSAYAIADERDAEIAERDELTAMIVAAARRPART
jgi:hypothetical protein